MTAHFFVLVFHRAPCISMVRQQLNADATEVVIAMRVAEIAHVDPSDSIQVAQKPDCFSLATDQIPGTTARYLAPTLSGAASERCD